nr:ribosomal RNA-processing protein 8 [Osmia lignaria]
MAKKIKKNANSVKINNTDISEKTVDKKKKQQQKKLDKNKVTIIRDQNLQFKSKLKKNKYQLAKKFKQIQGEEKSRTFTDIVDQKSVKILNPKNRGEGPKSKFQIVNKKQRRKGKNSERHKHKEQKKEMKQKKQKKEMKQNEHKIKIKNSNQSKSKTNSDKQFLNEKQCKSTMHKKNKKQIGDNKTKVDSALHKIKKKKSTPKKHQLDIKKLKKLVATKQEEIKDQKENTKPRSLRERMMTKLKASRFRYLNESLYSSESLESKNYFKNDPDAFKAYHEGYKQQVDQWPLNPLDIIITSIKKMPKTHVIADFGCGEGKLAVSVPHKVHSFDFISLNENVTACDVAHTPLLTSGVDVVVFCLSLMGTNLKDYIIEANRVLKKNGILKIAEVESRFEQVEDFIKILESYGFKNTWKDLSHNLFYFLDFRKEKDIGNKRNKLPPIVLKPCLYKKR